MPFFSLEAALSSKYLLLSFFLVSLPRPFCCSASGSPLGRDLHGDMDILLERGFSSLGATSASSAVGIGVEVRGRARDAVLRVVATWVWYRDWLRASSSSKS
uniref:Secreted protein n=1 Tax=Opuntia streptacantha TaxID=393608 RepID=A0A7C9E8C0_OPUST